VGTTPVVDRADFERALLGRAAGETVDVVIQRGDEKQTLALELAALDARPHVAHRTASLSTATTITPQPADERTKSWALLGVRLQALSPREKSLVGPRYRGGMKVVSVRHESPAERHGIREGDILVGLHVWETITPDNVDFVVNHPQLSKFNPLKFYVLRGTETLYGYLQLPSGR
jgi:serine protease Do